MKSRIASALALLACVGALSGCGGKNHAGRDAGTTGTGAVQPVAASAADPGAPQPSAGRLPVGVPMPAPRTSVSDPDGALTSWTASCPTWTAPSRAPTTSPPPSATAADGPHVADRPGDRRDG